MHNGNPVLPHGLRIVQGYHGGGQSACGGGTTDDQIEHKQGHKGIQISSKLEYIFSSQRYAETK